MSPKRERYDISLKRQVVSEVLELGHRQCDVARQYGLPDNRVSRWVNDYKTGASWARSASQIAEDNELLRLQKENRRLLQENEILKKASAYFAKNIK